MFMLRRGLTQTARALPLSAARAAPRTARPMSAPRRRWRAGAARRAGERRGARVILSYRKSTGRARKKGRGRVAEPGALSSQAASRT